MSDPNKTPGNAGAGQFPSDTADRFVVRLPDGLRDEIRAAAQLAGRSMNAEIIHRIAQQEAISRRLWIAARIMAGMIANPTLVYSLDTNLSGYALAQADELIALEREARP